MQCYTVIHIDPCTTYLDADKFLYLYVSRKLFMNKLNYTKRPAQPETLYREYHEG